MTGAEKKRVDRMTNPILTISRKETSLTPTFDPLGGTEKGLENLKGDQNIEKVDGSSNSRVWLRSNLGNLIGCLRETREASGKKRLKTEDGIRTQRRGEEKALAEGERPPDLQRRLVPILLNRKAQPSY